MSSRYQRLVRIYNAIDLIYRYELQRVVQLEHKLLDLAKAEAEECGHAFSTVPYQLRVARLNFLRIQRLNLTDERNLDFERALETGQKLRRISKLLAKLKHFS